MRLRFLLLNIYFDIFVSDYFVHHFNGAAFTSFILITLFAFLEMADKIALLKDAATRIRINSIKATEASKSGHPTSCSSIADVMAVLFLDEMKYFPLDPRNPSNDRFVLSKGHAAPALYAAWAEAGLLKESELLNLRKIDSDLEGHPTPVSLILRNLMKLKKWYIMFLFFTLALKLR